MNIRRSKIIGDGISGIAGLAMLYVVGTVILSILVVPLLALINSIIWGKANWHWAAIGGALSFILFFSIVRYVIWA